MATWKKSTNPMKNLVALSAQRALSQPRPVDQTVANQQPAAQPGNADTISTGNVSEWSKNYQAQTLQNLQNQYNNLYNGANQQKLAGLVDANTIAATRTGGPWTSSGNNEGQNIPNMVYQKVFGGGKGSDQAPPTYTPGTSTYMKAPELGTPAGDKYSNEYRLYRNQKNAQPAWDKEQNAYYDADNQKQYRGLSAGQNMNRFNPNELNAALKTQALMKFQYNFTDPSKRFNESRVVSPYSGKLPVIDGAPKTRAGQNIMSDNSNLGDSSQQQTGPNGVAGSSVPLTSAMTNAALGRNQAQGQQVTQPQSMQQSLEEDKFQNSKTSQNIRR